ncbi:MAG: glycosyl transferase family 1 [Crocinitomicaceae bacterium]|nr:glycosyl transferase family 1 [Crocinitomicaceae bacterium]|tara:strand:+ start:957 stop:2063 length:1107 start_codon:yes stop_codon:yes gene_type:complete
MKKKIAILGSRGIPNHYSGFEQLAEYLAQGLVKMGYEVSVYNSHDHPYQEKTWNGVNIIHCHDPEYKMGTFGQFIYDLNCIKDSRKRNFDLIFQLGYTSSTVWFWYLPKGSKIATNMDGLEWKRSKYSKPVQQFLKVAEWLGVIGSDRLISDSLGIQAYLKKKYKKDSSFIPYGAHLFSDPNPEVLSEFNLKPGEYDMLVARMEPENNIEMIIKGYLTSKRSRKLVVVGNTQKTPHGRYLKEQYQNENGVMFTEGIFDIDKLNNIRHHCHLYFHGHSVGGTNPSLLEAMASSALMAAHDNPFNKAILEGEAYYFSNPEDVTTAIETSNKAEKMQWITDNRKKITDKYTWDAIVKGYAQVIEELTNGKA